MVNMAAFPGLFLVSLRHGMLCDSSRHWWRRGKTIHSYGTTDMIFFKKLNNVLMHSFLSYVSRKPVHVICDISVGKFVQQQFCRFIASLSCSQEEWCFVLKHKVTLMSSVKEVESSHVIPANSDAHYNTSYFYVMVWAEIFGGSIWVLIVTKLYGIVVTGIE